MKNHCFATSSCIFMFLLLLSNEKRFEIMIHIFFSKLNHSVIKRTTDELFLNHMNDFFARDFRAHN